MASALPKPPDRPADSHKGTFGTVMVVGGCETMIGAPAFAAGAALRIGCGLAKIATLPSVLPFCLTVEPSAIGIALRYDDHDASQRLDRIVAQDDVLAIGPGMGIADNRRHFLEVLLRQPRPAVLDADGLNNLSNMDDPQSVARCPLVLTPHPGEFERLARAVNVHNDPTNPTQRPDAAAALARAYRAVVVLKGKDTVVSDGERTYVNTTGNPALATAGTGDVLTGAIAGLIAQGMDRYDAAVLGVYLHGLAADLWTQQFGPSGLTARQLLKLLPQALNQHRISCA